jgi:hypothetical protein
VSHAETDPKVTITAVITRADGTVEDLGVVASNTTTGSKGLVILKKIMKGRTNAG